MVLYRNENIVSEDQRSALTSLTNLFGWNSYRNSNLKIPKKYDFMDDNQQPIVAINLNGTQNRLIAKRVDEMVMKKKKIAKRAKKSDTRKITSEN